MKKIKAPKRIDKPKGVIRVPKSIEAEAKHPNWPPRLVIPDDCKHPRMDVTTYS